MYIKVIMTDDEFDQVRNEWLSFEKKVDNQNITSSYIWQRTWWKHFKDYESGELGYDKRLCVLFLYNKEDMLRAIAPFCEVTRKKWGVKYQTIEFIAQQCGATYLDIISDKLSEEEYYFIFDWLRNNRRYDFIELKYIPEFTPNFDLSKNNIAVLSACPEIMSDTYDLVRSNYYAKGLKSNLRRRLNKIKREGIDLTTTCLVSNQILDRFEEIKEVSMSKELSSKHCIYRNSRIEDFVKDLIKSYLENAMCFFIDHKSKAVAYKLGIRAGERYYAWDAAYSRNEKELKRLSLGNLDTDYAIRYLFNTGVRNFCFGSGADFHKLRFSKQIVKIYTLLKKGNTSKAVPLSIIKKRKNRRIEKTFNEELERNLNGC